MKLNHISKTYHNKHNTVHALKDINITIPSKGITYIVGPSGCGKTTLMNIIAGNDNDYEGTIENSGHVEVISQHINLIDSMSVMDNLLLVVDNNDLILKWLVIFELDTFKDYKIHQLSVGQKKRVQLIRSLLVNHNYLICDEPTASLDFDNSLMIMKHLQDLSYNHAVIIITHDLSLLEQYPGYVIHLDQPQPHSIDDQYQHTSYQPLKQSNKQHLSLIIKLIRNRPFVFITKTFFLFLISCIILVTIGLIPSLNSIIKQNYKWETQENLIIAQSRDHQLSSSKGDLYNDKTIHFIQDNINGIIGYQFGWQTPQFDYNTVFTPEMYVDDIKEYLSLEKDHTQPFYKECLTLMNNTIKPYEKHKPFPKDIPLLIDYRNLKTFTHAEHKTILDFLTFSKYRFKVQYYQLFKDIDLLYGRMTTNQNEIILSQDLALELSKAKGYTHFNQLLNQEETLYFNDPHINKKFKIVGIAYAKGQKTLFMHNNTMQQLLQDFHIINKDNTSYLYISLLTDVKEDAQQISKQLNQLLHLKNSEFIAYPQSILASHQQTTSPLPIPLFIGISCIIICTLYIIYLHYDKKRYQKELSIINHYGYHPIKIYGSLLAIHLITIYLLQILFSQKLIHSINNIMFNYGIPPLSTSILLPLIITTLLILLIEGVNYEMCSKKHP